MYVIICGNLLTEFTDVVLSGTHTIVSLCGELSNLSQTQTLCNLLLQNIRLGHQWVNTSKRHDGIREYTCPAFPLSLYYPVAYHCHTLMIKCHACICVNCSSKPNPVRPCAVKTFLSAAAVAGVHQSWSFLSPLSLPVTTAQCVWPITEYSPEFMLKLFILFCNKTLAITFHSWLHEDCVLIISVGWLWRELNHFPKQWELGKTILARIKAFLIPHKVLSQTGCRL